MFRILKILAGLAVLGVMLWVGWWILGARGQEAALTRWFEQRADAGWQAEVASVEVTGFPDKFVRRLDRPALADPKAGWAWSAPDLVLASPAIDPTRVEARFPAEQVFAVPGERATIRSGSMTALLALAPRLDLRLIEGKAAAKDLVVEGQSGWTGKADSLDLSVARREGGRDPPDTHVVSLDAKNVVLPKDLIAQLDPSGLLDPKVDAASLDALVVPSRPLDRHALEDGEIGAKTVVLRRAALDWGKMGLEASGRLDADAQGLAEGKIDLSLRDWRRLLALSRQSGALPSGIADAVETALEFVAMLNRSETLDLTLRFADGRMRIGPVTVGEAPRLIPEDAVAGQRQ